MNVSRQLAPALYVFRFFCVLPFSCINHDDDRHLLRSNVCSRIITLIVQIVVLFSYILHTMITIHQLINETKTKTIQEISTFVSLFIMQFIDITNLMNIIFLTQNKIHVK
jgi:hypothetical protein